MPKSNSSGAMFFCHLFIFGLTCSMTETPSPGVKNRRSYSRVTILRMFGDGVTISSDSSAADSPSHDTSSNPKCFVVGTFFFLRAFYLGKWSLSAILPLFWLQVSKVAWRSQIDIICVGGAHRSTIMQSNTWVCEAWAVGALSRFGVFVRFSVFALSRILAHYGVQVFPSVLALSRIRDWARLESGERTVLILRTWDERDLWNGVLFTIRNVCSSWWLRSSDGLTGSSTCLRCWD